MPPKKTLLSIVAAIPRVKARKGWLNNLDSVQRSEAIEVIKAYAEGSIEASVRQIVETLNKNGIEVGRYAFRETVENYRAGKVK